MSSHSVALEPSALVGPPKRRLRRGLFAAGAAAVGAIVAKISGPSVVSAAPGDPVIIGGNNQGAGSQTSLTASLVDPQGDGGTLNVVNNGGGHAIFGAATGAGAAFLGLTSTGSALNGQSLGEPGGRGLTGASQGAGGIGVFGFANQSVGVSGATLSAGGADIAGVVGQTGGAGSATGVLGKTSSGSGVVGQSTSGNGVTGTSGSSAGAHGLSTSQYGVRGTTSSVSTTTSAAGVFGEATNGNGVYGLTATGIGIRGGTVGTGLAGQFDGPTVVNGSMTVAGDFTATGIKSAAVPGPNGRLVRLYCVESPDSYFEDFDEAATDNHGVANVALSADFAFIVHTNDYQVFLTEYGDLGGLYVTNRGPKGFTVVSRSGASGPFGYRVAAKRKDIEGQRLAPVSIPRGSAPDAGRNVSPATLPPIKPHDPKAVPVPNFRSNGR
jgi:hypothetical protein